MYFLPVIALAVTGLLLSFLCFLQFWNVGKTKIRVTHVGVGLNRPVLPFVEFVGTVRVLDDLPESVVVLKPNVKGNRNLGGLKQVLVAGECAKKRLLAVLGFCVSNPDYRNCACEFGFGVGNGSSIYSQPIDIDFGGEWFLDNNVPHIGKEHGQLSGWPNSSLSANDCSLLTNQLVMEKGCLLSKLFGLLLNFPIGLVHRLQLAISRDGVADDGETYYYLKKNLPQWRWIGSGVKGFGLALWGWFNLRRDLRIFWGCCAVVVGCALWVYAVNTWCDWWLRS